MYTIQYCLSGIGKTFIQEKQCNMLQTALALVIEEPDIFRIQMCYRHLSFNGLSASTINIHVLNDTSNAKKSF